MQENISISVVMAAYNGERYIVDSLNSIIRQLPETAELIVVDDGSTDATADLVDAIGPPVIQIRQANAGQAAALNRGIQAATGAYLAFNDDDDLWAEDRLARQLELLQRQPDIDAVFGLSRQFVSPELPEERRRQLAPPRDIVAGELASCMLIRRASFDRVGLFDPALTMAYFFDWTERARAAGLRIAIPDFIVHHRRLHENNTGRVRRVERDAQLLGLLHRQIKAKRSAGAP